MVNKFSLYIYTHTTSWPIEFIKYMACGTNVFKTKIFFVGRNIPPCIFSITLDFFLVNVI